VRRARARGDIAGRRVARQRQAGEEGGVTAGVMGIAETTKSVAAG
jgi:hypothetical protein